MNEPPPLVRGTSYTTRTLSLQENTVYELEIVKGDSSYLIGRSYDDFRNLYLTLKKEFKSTQGKFPSFPRKTMFKAQRATVEKRTAFFVDFFKFILERPVLTKHPATQEFIKPRKQILTIGIEAGRNIASRNRNGLSDPFCKVTMYDTKNKVIGKPTRTPTVRNNLNPVWANQKFTFEVNENENCGGVTISCWSHDKIGRNPFLGRIVIPLSTIPVNADITRWFPLHHTKKYQTHDVHGEIKLFLHLKTMGVKKVEEPKAHDVDKATKKQAKHVMGTIRKEQQDERTRLKQIRERDRYAGEIRLVYRYTPPLGQWEGYLTVQVVEGKNITPPSGAKTADPYVVLGMGPVRERTKTMKKTLAPVWKKEVYYFYIPPHYVNLAFEVDLYDWNRFGTSDFLGDCSIELEDMQVDELTDGWHIMCSSPLTEEDIDKKLGKRMAEEGYTPNLPVVIVPGFGSSSLEITKSPLSSWVGDRVWLSLNKIAMQRVQRSTGIISENKWVQHLMLSTEDGKNDPDRISVRAIQGMDSVTYLDPGVLTQSLSYVMGPLVKNLASLGYTDSNMICAPYDWRLPPQHLEERDGYFTWLKQQITDCKQRENKKVVLFGHSMGNRTIQYFLNWVVNQDGGPQWISDNIHTFVACGAPWLGAPKCLRGLCTGDLLSLDGLLVRKEAIQFARTAGSTLQLLPIDPNLGREHPCFFTKQESGQTKLGIVNMSQMLKMSGAERQTEWLNNYYAQDRNFGGGHSMENLPDWPIFRPPPVSRVFVIYGVGLETEKFQFYKENTKKKRIDLDENPPISENDEKWKCFKIKKGIAYETADTPQDNIARFTGRPGNNSGDGTVPYASLSYPYYWRKMAPSMDLRIEELIGVEHREILNNRLFFRKFIEYVAEKPEKITSPGDLTLRAKNYLAHYNMSNNQAYVQDIDDEESDDEGEEGGGEKGESN